MDKKNNVMLHSWFKPLLDVTPTPPNDFYSTVVEMTFAGVAVMGGIARYLDQYLRDKTTLSVSKILAQAVVSGFSGYMAAKVMLLFRPEWAFVTAGMGGFLGTQAIEMLWERMIAIIKAEKTDSTK